MAGVGIAYNAPMNDAPKNEDPSELVPLPVRISRVRKARWVQQSRAEGKKLVDWIVERVEREDGGRVGEKKDDAR